MDAPCRDCGGIADAKPARKKLCKPCAARRVREWRWKDPRRTLFARAGYNATKHGHEFAITEADIPPIPSVCPALGVPLVPGFGDQSPSLDRIDSNKGYVPGNLQVISWRANRLKNDATFEEIEALYLWMLHKEET